MKGGVDFHVPRIWVVRSGNRERAIVSVLSVSVGFLVDIHFQVHRYAITELEDDPNYDSSVDLLGDEPVIIPSDYHLLTLIIEEDSPYPEVRSAVANTDDPQIPVSTLRAWMIGLIWAVIIPGLNQFFYMRFPSVTVTSVSGLYQSELGGRLILLGAEDCCAVAFIPSWPIVGKIRSSGEVVWVITQSGAFHCQGTCKIVILGRLFHASHRVMV